MNGREIINFFTKTKTGPIVAFLIIGTIVMIFLFGVKEASNASKNKFKDSSRIISTNLAITMPQRVKRNVTPMVVKNVVEQETVQSSRQVENQERIKVDLPITLFNSADQKGSGSAPQELTEIYAPYGRLIPCQLIISVDSANIETPIIGNVTEDLWHDGRLIIPAGAEVHGTAQADKYRERISSSGSWIIVWRTADELNGTELRLSGIALDMEKDYDSGTGEWALTDGTAGLKGELIRSDNLAEIKLFAATFLGEAANILEERQFSRPNTFSGEQAVIVENSPRNAVFAGIKAVTDRYVDQILKAIERDGFFVRVPAGKQFYLYVTQTIDRGYAEKGAMLKN